ncbi:sugar transferase [Croceicoccus gelatinilyticus]|uniref:sugar transferase n=1 Tax=Croceicoccus gelatinilyticus TaxID=2835536 RepID=UPI001BCF7406|nr:sugar transferase [Croceicoccus gelatinilyticus]MBS7669681.1 sugar transferase [Croceicoccus gelatinilyticus]
MNRPQGLKEYQRPIGTVTSQAPDALGRTRLFAPTVEPLEKRRLQCYLALVVADIFGILIAFTGTATLYYGPGPQSHALLQAQLMLPLYLTVALYNGAYNLGALRVSWRTMGAVLRAVVLAALAMVLLTYLSKTASIYSRLVFLLGISGCLVVLPALRIAMRRFVRWRCGERIENVLVVNDGGPDVAFPGAYVVDARAEALRPDLSDPVALDRLGQWFGPMDRVLITCEDDRKLAWAMALKGLSVEGEVVDERVEKLGALGANHVGGQGFLLVSHKPLGLRARAMKRMLDLALTIPAIIILSPLMLAVAVLIWAEDRGPSLFVQKRTGRASRFFRMYKFRSMRLDRQDEHGTRSASRDDDRVTRIGRFIRRTSIDELPQLFNVLSGEMSVVGPRPHAPGSQAGDKLFWEVDERYWQRHMLKPGLTGLAQIRGFRGATENEVDLLDRLQADLQYLDGWSIWRDVGIIFATLRVLVHHRAF